MGPDELIDGESCPLSDYVYFQEGPGIRKSQNVDDGICYLNIRCFVEGKIDKSSMHQVLTTEAFGKYKHFLLDAGDYVVSSSGTLGRLVEIFAEDLPVMLNTSTIRFRPKDASQLDRVFLKYFLLSATFQSQVRKLATGSVQLNFGPSHLQQVRMPKVPLIIQRGIVSIVEPIDEKITTNKTQIKILEEIAQTIFKSWFIDFDPVKAKMAGEKPVGMDDATAALFPDSMEDSELGPIPRGWSVRDFGDVNNLLMGQSPPGDTFNTLGDGVPFYQGRTDFGTRFPKQRVFCTAGTRFAKTGEVLISVRAPVGDLNQAIENCVIGRGVASAIHNSGSQVYSYALLNSLKPKLAYYNGEGTVFGAINRSDFQSLKVVEPVHQVVDLFDRTTGAMNEEIRNLFLQTESLIQMRDSLLPRLISGELPIPEEMLGA